MILSKSTKSLLMLTILTWCTPSYSAEYLEIGHRDGLVIETAVNVWDFVYVVGERSPYEYSYGLALGYEGNFYSSLLSFSQVTGDINQYKTEIQASYSDGSIVLFTALSLKSKRKDLGYKIGIGYPLNKRVSISTYISNNGFFLGFRREL